ncbi:EamA-like transporter family protein [Nitzschia inconspicua]|uniref:EamA-like transporter family protein n=1 Tax=Nitzschia inconspicua TaxID=303405 RepID=A0A9K3Q0X0_9STRA|nr:EamA-like transporter family protein [Nitzschia inconspicua]
MASSTSMSDDDCISTHSNGISLQNYKDDRSPHPPEHDLHLRPSTSQNQSTRIITEEEEFLSSRIPPLQPTTTMSSCRTFWFSLSSYALGLVFIVIVAVIWSVASVVVQYLYKEQDFDAPFLLTYIGTSLFTVLLLFPYHGPTGVPPSEHQQALGRYQQVALSEEEQDIGDQEDHPPPSQTYQEDPMSRLHLHNTANSKLWTDLDHRIAAAKIAPVWFISNFAYNASLRYTSITSSTILVNTGSLFTFLFALLTRDEHFHIYKLLGVLCGMSGCVLTGLHDASSSGGDESHHRRLLRFVIQTLHLDDRLLSSFQLEEPSHDSSNTDDNPVWGDVLSLVSAVFYGVYAVMVRVLCPHDESLMSMKRFLGYVGLWNMLALSPVVIWEVWKGSVTFSSFVFVCLIGKGLFDNVLSDYLWARAVVLTSATVATVGLGLTIPLAFLSDVVLGRPDVMNVKSIFGAIAVLTGFVLVNVGQQHGEEGIADVNGHPPSSTQTPYHHHRSDISSVTSDHVDGSGSDSSEISISVQ